MPPVLLCLASTQLSKGNSSNPTLWVLLELPGLQGAAREILWAQGLCQAQQSLFFIVVFKADVTVLHHSCLPLAGST